MRCIVAAVVVWFAAPLAADESPRASGRLEAKPLAFAQKGIADGVKATIGLLESCHDESLYQADEFKKAEQGDHVRLVFARPITAKVMNEKIAFSELVFRLPMNTGVFWVRTGDTWRRYAKYEFPKEAPFTAWLRQTRPAD